MDLLTFALRFLHALYLHSITNYIYKYSIMQMNDNINILLSE